MKKSKVTEQKATGQPEQPKKCRHCKMKASGNLTFTCEKCGFTETGCTHRCRRQRLDEYNVLCTICGGILPDMDKLLNDKIKQIVDEQEKRILSSTCEHELQPGMLPEQVQCVKCGLSFSCPHNNVESNNDICFCLDCQTPINRVQ